MRVLAFVVAGLLSGPALAASTPKQDALVADYFAIWDDNRNVTPETVARLYAPQIIYYGHVMSQRQLLADKLNFVRRWPNRRYAIAPGSAARTCDPAETSCQLTAVLVWTTQGAGGTRSGRSRIRLTLARVGGVLKIVRESAVTLS